MPTSVKDVGPPVALALAGLAEVHFADIGPQPAAALVAALAPLPLLVRRRAPVLSGLAAVTIATSGQAFGIDMNEPTVPIAVLFLACFGFGLRCRLRRGLLGALGTVLLVHTAGGTAPDELIGPDLLFATILVLASFAAGRLVRTRSQALEAVARGAQAQAHAARESAVATERARIARELHDLIAHSLSVMVVQAGAAEQVLDSDRERARRAVQTVQSTGREALDETRRLLDLLRDGQETDVVLPQPGLRELGQLDARFPDLDIAVHIDDDLSRELPAGAEVSVYRVVLEALTNVLKHSGSRCAVVELRRTDEGVLVHVEDGGPPSGAAALPGGHGLVGMAERVALYGGQLTAGPSGHGGFRVTANFPHRAPP